MRKFYSIPAKQVPLTDTPDQAGIFCFKGDVKNRLSVENRAVCMLGTVISARQVALVFRFSDGDQVGEGAAAFHFTVGDFAATGTFAFEHLVIAYPVLPGGIREPITS